jgi:carboxypeptidase C (cathepsin A)
MRALCLCAALLLVAPALAQPAAHSGTAHAQSAEALSKLPDDSVTHHVLTLPGRTLHVTATAGAVRLTDTQGQPQADIAFLAYTLDDADPATRPVAFAVNGGPGASSAWLQLGALGPWRLALQGPPAPSSPSTPVANAETWLDFTDLVFIDPPGTGFSRLATESEEVRRRFYAVEGDIPPLAEVIRRWTVRQGRTASPHLVVGESYGGFRGPRLVRALQSEQGLGVSGLVLVSPVLDFGWPLFDTDPISLAGLLPSMAAVAAEASGREPDLEAA